MPIQEVVIGGRALRLLHGDITTVPTDAMGNAANRDLAGGGGVDGAIHRAGGPAIMAELDRIRGAGCRPGSAVITGAGNLPAKHVIHAVGPIWRGGGNGEKELLASAYVSSLRLAEKAAAKKVTFPSISTGVYAFPLELAAPIALGAVVAFIEEEAKSLQEVVFVLFDEKTLGAYGASLETIGRRF